MKAPQVSRTRIDPWGTAIPGDYDRLMREFGIRPFGELIDRVPDPHLLMRRGIIFGHRDFDRVLDAMLNGYEYAVVSGLMPSGKMHIGHKLVIDQLIWYQGRGAEIFLPIADLEAYSARGVPFEESKRLAIDEYLVNFQALGLDVGKCRTYFESRSGAVLRLAYTLAKKVNFSEVRAIYGFKEGSSVSGIFFPMVDVADILHPQMEEFGGPRPTVVPVGVDQDPHLRLARDIASRFQREFGFILPSSTYHRLLPGLTGEKMSSSNPETAIFLTDTVEAISEKIRGAFTGGRPTAAEQRRYGGDPDKCRVYELYAYHLMQDDERLLELRGECESGKLICGDCKARAIDLMAKFIKAHHERRKRAEPKMMRLGEKIYGQLD